MGAEASVEVASDGTVTLRGSLGFAEARALTERAGELFAGRQRVCVDLSHVERGDSAGVALLLEWCRAAHQAGCELHYRNLPEPLGAIARVCGVDTLLPLDDDGI